MDIPINYVAVIVAAVIGFGIGGLWYSPVLFAKRWMQLVGIHEDEMRPGHPVEAGKISPMAAMAVEFILTLLTAYVLAHFLYVGLALTVGDAMVVAFWLWLGFQMPMLLASVLFERRPLQLFVLNAAHRLVAILVMAAILGVWR